MRLNKLTSIGIAPLRIFLFNNSACHKRLYESFFFIILFNRHFPYKRPDSAAAPVYYPEITKSTLK